MQEASRAVKVTLLATVILTRRGDLTFLDTRKNTGLDLHVHIEREDKAGRGSGVFSAGRGKECGTNPEMKTRAGGRPARQFSFSMNRRTSLQRLSTQSLWKARKAMGQDEGGRFTRVRRAAAGSSP